MKVGQTVTFRAGRLREYPVMTGRVKGKMKIIALSPYPIGDWVTVEDEAGTQHKFMNYWLKPSRK